MAATKQETYYELLGVPRNADEKSIRAAFRKLARKHHPDVNRGDAAAEDRFKAINQANEVLTDPANRKLYDRYGDEWARYKEAGFTGDEPRTTGFPASNPGGHTTWRSASPGGGSSYRFETSDEPAGFGDFVSSLFGARRGDRPGFAGSTRQTGEDVEVQAAITFDEAFNGTARRVEIHVPESCATCGGTGYVRQAPCPTCDATGLTLKSKTIEITVPAGVRNGQRIRVAGQGGAGSGGAPSGDVYLNVQVRPSERFERDGNNLRTDIDVPFYTAALGGEVVVPTPTSRVALTVPAESQSGRLFRLRGQGMPTGKGGKPQRGDLLVRLRITIPTGLSEREQQLLSELQTIREVKD